MTSTAAVISVKRWYWFCLAAWVVGFFIICLFHIYAPGSVRTHRYKHTFNDEELYMMSLWGFTGEAPLATGPSDGMVYAAVPGQGPDTKPKMDEGHIIKSSEASDQRKNKVDTRTDTREIHRQRAKNIRDVCARQRHEPPSNRSTPSKLTANHVSNLTLNRMYVSDSRRFMYCFIPDNGLNNSKRLWMFLNNSQLGTDDISSKGRLKILRNYAPEERQKRLKSYKKILFVRDPLTRMIAVWLNKCRSSDGNQNIVNKNHRNATVGGIQTDEDVTWSEWISHLTNQQGESNFDGRWMQMSELCSPCDIAYDFIGKLDTVNEDINYISKSLNLTNHISPFPAANSIDSRTANKTFNEIKASFKDVSRRKKQTIWDMYKLDYQMFGYPKPDILN